MLAQWKKVCAKEVMRKRSNKTRNQRREDLQTPFFSRYVIESGLYKQEELKPVDSSSLYQKEADANK